MDRAHFVLISSLTVLSSASLGCGEDKIEAKCWDGTCRTPKAMPDPAPVSFRAQVLPIFGGSCNSASCHGLALATPPGALPSAELYLGKETATPDAEIGTIITDLTGSSSEATTAKLVVAGEPGSSYLMAKVDGCQNGKGLACMIRVTDHPKGSGTCGDAMPPPGSGYAGLCDDDANLIRRWIAQGALNN